MSSQNFDETDTCSTALHQISTSKLKSHHFRKDTPASTAFDSNRQSKDGVGTSAFLNTLGSKTMQGMKEAAIMANSSNNMSERGANPYISSERIMRDN